MSKLYISQYARNVIDSIADESNMVASRVKGGFISPSQAPASLNEALNSRAKRDPQLRHFLSDVGPISRADDESKDREWAEDPRDDSFHEVRDGPGTPDKLFELEWELPLPGERIA